MEFIKSFGVNIYQVIISFILLIVVYGFFSRILKIFSLIIGYTVLFLAIINFTEYKDSVSFESLKNLGVIDFNNVSNFFIKQFNFLKEVINQIFLLSSSIF